MEVNNLKEMDCVKVIVEKDRYVQDSVHQGMQGWICDPRNLDDSWLVNFPQCGKKGILQQSQLKKKI